MTDERVFERQVTSYRRELLAHCYRMLGSADEAEDLVQETLLRVWRARDSYDEGRASMRTWLYRIAANTCLNALEGRSRRPLPSGLGQPSQDPHEALTPAFDIPWLQPLPTVRATETSHNPATVVEKRGTLRLALIVAMQQLPPRQRAVLILRTVLAFTASETGQMLGATEASVNSSLQRARASLNRMNVREDEVTEAEGRQQRAVLDRYMSAFEQGNVHAIVQLLTDDAVLEMPPVPLWYRGRSNYGAFIRRIFEERGGEWLMTAASANGQPAAAAYSKAADGAFDLHTLQVLTILHGRVSHNVVFQDPKIFSLFQLPTKLDRMRHPLPHS